MQSPHTTAEKPTAPAAPAVAFVLNKNRLEELRKAHGIETNEDLARVIGVNTATLHRVTKGDVTPSNSFMARVAVAFPSTSFDQLFTIVVTQPLRAVA